MLVIHLQALAQDITFLLPFNDDRQSMYFGYNTCILNSIHTILQTKRRETVEKTSMETWHRAKQREINGAKP